MNRKANGIGSKVRERRLALNLTQERLGKKLGVDRSRICRIESGEAPGLTVASLAELAKALKCSTGDLLS